MRTKAPHLIGFTIGVMAVLCLVAPSFAADGIHTVGVVTDNTDTTPEVNPTFSVSDAAPYIYVRTSAHTTNTVIDWYLNYGITGESLLGSVSYSPPSDKNYWALTPDTNWDTGHLGTWTIVAKQGNAPAQTASLTLVPEPISATLFLLGGVALVGRAIRKNKKQA